MSSANLQVKIITFPSSRKSGWEEVVKKEIIDIPPSSIDIDCKDHFMNFKDIQKLHAMLKKQRLTINTLRSNNCETIISASALGLQAYLNIEEDKIPSLKNQNYSNPISRNPVTFHQGTLRAGENIDAEENLMVLGDVNPGARVSAEGDVMIWGRLRGTAHAGKSGNTNAKIIALQLRPLQLRIADKIARGPEEKPQEGLAEEAIIQNGEIVIQPAKNHPRDFFAQ